MGRILIKGATLLSSPQATPTVGDILIDGAYIKEVGAVGDVPVDEIIDGRGFLATPGLINGHSHVAMGFFRGWPDDLPLQTWLEEWIWPAEAKLTVEDVYWGSLLGIGEMLLAGVTAFADMYILMEGVAQAVYDSGARANLSRGIVCAEPGEVGLRENIQLVEKWHGRGDGRISVSFAPHAIYTCPPPFLREVVAEARRRDVGLHMHVSETAVEVEDCRRQWGQSPVEVLAEEGFLDRRLLAAHCVHLSSRDLDLLAQGGCYVAHNPTSNLKLASGIAPVPEMAAREIPVLLGTDGPASNDNLDLLEEIRLTALIHKRSGQPGITARQALGMGMDASFFPGKLGQLAPDYLADIVLWDMSGPHWSPGEDLIQHLVYAANSRDVHTVIVNGQVLVADGRLRTMDLEQVKHEVDKRSRPLRKG